jgi:hypothetical protein
MKKRQLINEIMGVPKAIDDWVYYLTSMVAVMLEDIIKEDQWEAGEGSMGGEKMTYYSMTKVWSGKAIEENLLGLTNSSDLKELLDSSLYKEFPLYKPELTTEVTVIPDEIYEKETAVDNRVEAMHSYDVDKIKVGKLGKKPIYTNNKFTFKLLLPYSYIENPSQEKQKKLINSLIPSVSHELLHSYQQFKQLEKGKQPGYGKETVLNAAVQQLRFGETPSWNSFLHLVYLHLSFELNARVTELYYHMKRQGVKTKEQAIDVLRKSPSYEDYKMLRDFDTDKFLEEFEAEILIPDPLMDLFHKFLGKQGKELPKFPQSNEEWMDELINKWDMFIQGAQGQIRKLGVDIPIMEKVPQKAKEQPYYFFKFFENRFHKKAENFRRKLSRVVYLVISEEENKQEQKK